MGDGDGGRPPAGEEGGTPLRPEDLVLRTPERPRPPGAADPLGYPRSLDEVVLTPEDVVVRTPEAAPPRRVPARERPRGLDEGGFEFLEPEDLVLRNPERETARRPEGGLRIRARDDTGEPELQPEDLVLRTTEEPRRRFVTAPKKPPPRWLKHLRPLLALVLPLLGLILLMWRLQPVNTFSPPPDSVQVENVQVGEHEGLPVLTGDVSNKSGRTARRLTFVVEYRLEGQDRSSFVVVEDVPDQGTKPFFVPLVFSEPGDVSVIRPGKAPALEGVPRFVPYDSQW